MLIHGFTREEADASRAAIGAGIAVHGDITTEAGSLALIAGCAAAAAPSIS